MQNCNTAAYSRAYYKKRRDELLARLGGRCVICGSTDSLEIDHIDPATKSFTLSDMILHMSKEKLRCELDKCQLLCRKCHLEKSKQDLSKMFSKEKHPMYGKCGAESKCSKPVIDLDTGEEFCSATAYADHYGLNKICVARVCRGERRSIDGHRVAYK